MDIFDNLPPVVDLQSGTRGPMSVILVMETEDILESEKVHEISDSTENVRTIHMCTRKCSLMRNDVPLGPCNYHLGHLNLTSNLLIKDNTILPSANIYEVIKNLLEVVKFYSNSSHNYHKDLASKLKSELSNLYQFYNSLNDRKKRKLPAAVHDACKGLNNYNFSGNEDKKQMGSEGYHSSPSVCPVNFDDRVNSSHENLSSSYSTCKSCNNFDSLDFSEPSISDEISKDYHHSEVKSNSVEYCSSSGGLYNSFIAKENAVSNNLPKVTTSSNAYVSSAASQNGSKLSLSRENSLCNKNITKYSGFSDFEMSGLNCFKDIDRNLEFVNSTPKDSRLKYLHNTPVSVVNEFKLGCDRKGKNPIGSNFDQNYVQQYNFNSEISSSSCKNVPCNNIGAMNSSSNFNVSSSSREFFNLISDNECLQNLSSSCNRLDKNPVNLDLLVKNPNQNTFGFGLTSDKNVNSSCDMFSINNDQDALPSEMKCMSISHVTSSKVSSKVLQTDINKTTQQDHFHESPKVATTKPCLGLHPRDSPSNHKECHSSVGVPKPNDRRIDIHFPIDLFKKPCVHLERLDSISVNMKDVFASKKISDTGKKRTPSSGRINIIYCNKLPYTKNIQNGTKLDLKRKFCNGVSKIPDIDSTKKLCFQKIFKNIAIHSSSAISDIHLNNLSLNDTAKFSLLEDDVLHSSKIKPNIDIKSNLQNSSPVHEGSKLIFKKKKKRSPYVRIRRVKEITNKIIAYSASDNNKQIKNGIQGNISKENEMHVKANSSSSIENPSTHKMDNSCSIKKVPPLKLYMGDSKKKITSLDLCTAFQNSDLELNERSSVKNLVTLNKKNENKVSNKLENTLSCISPNNQKWEKKFPVTLQGQETLDKAYVKAKPVTPDNFKQGDFEKTSTQLIDDGNFVAGKSTPTTTDDDVMSILAGDLQDLPKFYGDSGMQWLYEEYREDRKEFITKSKCVIDVIKEDLEIVEVLVIFLGKYLTTVIFKIW